MKKFFSTLLIAVIMFLGSSMIMYFVISTNGENIAQGAEEQIEITSDNFLDYFSVVPDVKVDANRRTVESSSSKSPYYHAKGEISVTIVARYPCTIHNLSFNVTGLYSRLKEFSADLPYDSHNVSIPCFMPQSGYCKESIDIQWLAPLMSSCTLDYEYRTMLMEYVPFEIDKINVNSGYIVLKDN